MKKTMIFLTVLCAFTAKAQWSLTGNAGTNPTTNFLGTTDNKDLVFKTNNLERMKINSNGSVNIGGLNFYYTNSPTYQNIISGLITFKVDEWETYFNIYNAPNDYNHFRIDGTNKITYLEEDPAIGGKVVIGTKNNFINCGANCDGYRLFVKDGIKTEKVKVEFANVNGWADYVFEKDYKLMPLNEVKKFIEINKHLPEVPTAQEVVDNGLELKEFNALLLKKVEELTLHIIKLNENMEEQSKRINELENKK